MDLSAAEIIAVGSELLTPHRTDTNSLFLTERLNESGIVVQAKHAVGDRAGSIRDLVRGALARVPLVIVTGGLGPTADDLTREAVAEAVDRPLEERPDVLDALHRRFAARGTPMPASNRQQALAPAGAEVLPNPAGTAPGLWIEIDERVVVLLPGPPRELRPMVDEHVLPRLRTRGSTGRVHRRVIKITGRSEAAVDETARPLYEPWQRTAVPIETTILSTPGQIEIHLSTAGDAGAEIDAVLDAAVRRLADALTPYVFSTDGRSLEAVVGERLRERGMTIAAAESCTGGLLLGRMTDVSGSSAWVVGGVVAYDNRVKTDMLGVPADRIASEGAVSESVAVAMAEGVRQRLWSTVGVAITGIAGPTGGTPEKPVGTVVIAVAATTTSVRTMRFIGDRETVRKHSVAAALDMVRRAIG